MQPSTPRVVMIGDSSVGKTSLVFQLCKNEYNSDTKPTVATTFYTLEGDPEKSQQSLQIWDTAGAERYRALNSVYYHNAMGGILVFDLTSRTSFESLSSWYDEFRDLAQPNSTLVIVGNKFDIYETASERVRLEEAEKWAATKGCKYISTSAVDGTGIAELKEYILDSVRPDVDFHPSTIDISKPHQQKAQSNKKCCS